MTKCVARSVFAAAGLAAGVAAAGTVMAKAVVVTAMLMAGAGVTAGAAAGAPAATGNLVRQLGERPLVLGGQGLLHAARYLNKRIKQYQ
jgi:hypothetical protein